MQNADIGYIDFEVIPRCSIKRFGWGGRVYRFWGGHKGGVRESICAAQPDDFWFCEPMGPVKKVF